MREKDGEEIYGGTRVREKDREEIYGEKRKKGNNCDGKMRNERNPYERGVDKSI